VDWGTIKNYATQVIPVIRANSPNSIIVVGTPNFSSSVGDVANNRINLPNIMYTMHFYCGNATNEADNPGARTNVSNLMAQGVAVFVTEWGCSNYTGDGGPYPNTANNYLNWMATEKISWANWSLTTKAEGSAFLKPSATMSGPWTDADLSADGLFMKNKF
jgi:endoglucanase